MLGGITSFAVTPFVGVWIETGIPSYITSEQPVTPFVGVWIETRIKIKAELKLAVTPFVGVWIETLHIFSASSSVSSHPSWVCGLKPNVSEGFRFTLCHTLRGCVD